MSSKNRIIIAVLLIVGIVGLVLGVTFIQRQAAYQTAATGTPLPPGSIPIYYNGGLVGGFKPDDLAKMQKVQFTDTAENKLQGAYPYHLIGQRGCPRQEEQQVQERDHGSRDSEVIP